MLFFGTIFALLRLRKIYVCCAVLVINSWFAVVRGVFVRLLLTLVTSRFSLVFSPKFGKIVCEFQQIKIILRVKFGERKISLRDSSVCFANFPHFASLFTPNCSFPKVSKILFTVILESGVCIIANPDSAGGGFKETHFFSVSGDTFRIFANLKLRLIILCSKSFPIWGLSFAKEKLTFDPRIWVRFLKLSIWGVGFWDCDFSA